MEQVIIVDAPSRQALENKINTELRNLQGVLIDIKFTPRSALIIYKHYEGEQ